MVREDDAVALVADTAQALARRGHDVRLAEADAPRLIRLGALLFAELVPGRAGAGSGS
jgi:hypothetical protein